MSTATPRHRLPQPTAVSLRRWLCGWLAVLMALQMIASALAGPHGSWHRHRPTAYSAAPATPIMRWQHGDHAVRATRADAHLQMHAHGEAHDHAATDATVLPLGADAAADAVAQLGASLAPAADVRWRLHEDARHELAGCLAWVATSRSIAPPVQPPRG